MRYLIALFLLAWCQNAQAQNVETRKYGEITTIEFSLYDVTGATLKADVTPAAGDCSIRLDSAPEVECTATFADEGVTYSIGLSAEEMEAKRIMLCFQDADATDAYLPKCIKILTFGHASAQFPDTTATDVWANATRTITDKTGFSCSAGRLD